MKIRIRASSKNNPMSIDESRIKTPLARVRDIVYSYMVRGGLKSFALKRVWSADEEEKPSVKIEYR